MKLTLQEQLALIKYSIKSNIPFADLLEENGYDYDSLVYVENENKQHYAPFVPVDERGKTVSGIPCVSFFSGAGGIDIGFSCAGYENILDVEINQMFCETLRLNGAQNIIGPPDGDGDMNNYENIIAQMEGKGIQRKFHGVFHGGPPCQSFSVAANQRFSKNGDNFKRTGFHHEKYGNLLFCYVQIICYFLPEVFLIENVDGLLTIDGGEQVKTICSLLRKADYDVVNPQVINAADYGVPQKRLRTIIVGSRLKRFKYPAPELFHIPSGSVFERDLTGVENQETRKHCAESIERYMKLSYGKRDKLGRVDRLDPRIPSKTIIAGGTGGGGRSHLHPYIPRTMSVRECARLQTFPDSYKFSGPVARQFTQVGNAVPPLLAYVFANAIFNSCYK